MSLWKKIVAFFLIGANGTALFVPIEQTLGIVVLTSVILFSTEVTKPVHSGIIIMVLLFLHVSLDKHMISFPVSGFQSPILYFLLAVTGMGTAVAKSGLGKWFLQQLGRGIRKWSLPLPVLLALSFIPLSLILPSSITRNAMLYPLMQNFLEPYSPEETKRIYLIMGILNPLASSALLTGGLSSIVTAGLLGGFTWGKWFLLMALPYYAVLFVGVMYILIRYPTRDKAKQRAEQNGKDKLQRFPTNFGKDDWILLLILVLTVGLWVSDSWHQLHPAVPAMIALIFICMFTHLLKWKDVQHSSVWGNIIILGALLSLIETLQSYGMLRFITEYFSQLFSPEWSALALLILMIGCTILFNIFIPNITVCLTFLIPLFTGIAGEVGLEPVLVGLTIAIVVDGIKFYPSQSTPLLMVYDREAFTIKDISQMGIAMTILFLFVLCTVILPYWHLLGLKL